MNEWSPGVKRNAFFSSTFLANYFEMSKTTLSSIPTLSQLFKNGSIKNNPTGKAFKEASRVFKEASRVSLWQGSVIGGGS